MEHMNDSCVLPVGVVLSNSFTSNTWDIAVLIKLAIKQAIITNLC